MPTYHYRCSSCGHSFDAFQKFSEDPLTDCPQCEGSIRRVIQPVGVVFKGSGWYITDSRSSSKSAESKPAEPNGADKPEKPATETKSDGTDVKPAAEKKTEKVAAPA
jgi:putative FmdB family regulatory protein